MGSIYLKGSAAGFTTIRVFPKEQILDERGCVHHMLRNDDKEFEAFGEIYFSEIYPGQVKAWHFHKRMELNYLVIRGRIRLLATTADPSDKDVFIDEIFLGPENHVLVKVPACCWNGFECIGNEPALIANCASIPYDPNEIQRFGPDAFDKDLWFNRAR